MNAELHLKPPDEMPPGECALHFHSHLCFDLVVGALGNIGEVEIQKEQHLIAIEV